ncbi:MAG: hypothetical protein P8Y58_00295 [Novosphingobium sp.]
MGSGKLLLLLIAGSVGAGVLAAGATTHAMRVYPKMPSPAVSGRNETSPHPAYGRSRSWLDDGLSALDIPAWPFGRDEWDGSDDSGRHREPGYGVGQDALPGADHDALPAPAGPEDADQNDAPSTPDAAAVAATRAMAAAQDVIAAERGVN